MRFTSSFLFVVVLFAGPARAIESLGYETVARHADMEIRRYDAHALATVNLDAEFDKAGSLAFRDLFGFIDGDNADDTNISMTAPVLQHAAGSGWDVSFVMPAALTRSAVPAPDAPNIKITFEPAMLMAALTYSGNWSRKRYLQKESALRAAMEEAGYRACGAPRFARHNPPFWPSFWRKNEVLIPLCDENPEAPAR